MSPARRLPRLADNPFDPGDRVLVRFENRLLEGFSHEPLAVALLAGGVRVFGRSIKYHRPRGPVCLHAHCSGCLVRVDDQPSVRSCETLCRDGQVVARQAGWPNTTFDAFRSIDHLYPTGLDHHSLLTGHATLGRWAVPIVRQMAGYGEPPSGEPVAVTPMRSLQTALLVVGGGPAGLRCAAETAKIGVRTVLLERENHLGGRLLDAVARLGNSADAPTGWQTLPGLRREIEAVGVEVHTQTTALAVYPGQPFRILAGGEHETLLIEAERVAFCCGAYDGLPIVEGNDLPGLLSLRGLDRLVLGHGVLPAEPVALAGNSRETVGLAIALQAAGVPLAGVVTSQPEGRARLEEAGIPVISGSGVARARGRTWLQALEIATGTETKDRRISCRLAALEAPPSPAFELAHHAGCRVDFSSASGYFVRVDENGRTSENHLFAAGDCTGKHELPAQLDQAERAARACVDSLRKPARRPTSSAASQA